MSNVTLMTSVSVPASGPVVTFLSAGFIICKVKLTLSSLSFLESWRLPTIIETLTVSSVFITIKEKDNHVAEFLTCDMIQTITT